MLRVPIMLLFAVSCGVLGCVPDSEFDVGEPSQGPCGTDPRSSEYSELERAAIVYAASQNTTVPYDSFNAVTCAAHFEPSSLERHFLIARALCADASGVAYSNASPRACGAFAPTCKGCTLPAGEFDVTARASSVDATLLPASITFLLDGYRATYADGSQAEGTLDWNSIDVDDGSAMTFVSLDAGELVTSYYFALSPDAQVLELHPLTGPVGRDQAPPAFVRTD